MERDLFGKTGFRPRIRSEGRLLRIVALSPVGLSVIKQTEMRAKPAPHPGHRVARGEGVGGDLRQRPDL